MTGPTYPGIEEVLPQAGRMVLLTRIVGHTEERTTCAVEVSTASPFYDGQGGVPAWVALEYMAQCVAAHGGLRRPGGRASGGVVVTGMPGLCPRGSDWPPVRTGLRAGRSGVRVMREWDAYEGLDTRLGAPVLEFSVPSHYTRKKVRSMGRVALLATRATELALADAGLAGSSILPDGSTGIAYGSA